MKTRGGATSCSPPLPALPPITPGNLLPGLTFPGLLAGIDQDPERNFLFEWRNPRARTRCESRASHVRRVRLCLRAGFGHPQPFGQPGARDQLRCDRLGSASGAGSWGSGRAGAALPRRLHGASADRARPLLARCADEANGKDQSEVLKRFNNTANRVRLSSHRRGSMYPCCCLDQALEMRFAATPGRPIKRSTEKVHRLPIDRSD